MKNKSTYFLVTTADARTWPSKENAKVLFLGEWCKLAKNSKYIENFDATTLSYHWNDREKFHKDYHYINNVYEILLVRLSSQLNEIHKVSYSIQYWRIFIGPWLNSFIQSLFNSWSSLDMAFENYDIKFCKILIKDFQDIIPNSMKDFRNMYLTDEWNEALYGQLICKYFSNKVHIKLVKDTKNNVAHTSESRKIFSIDFRKILSNVYFLTNKLLPRNYKYVFIESRIPRKIEFKLQALLGQIPRMVKSVKIPYFPLDMQGRRQSLNIEKDDDIFLRIACDMLLMHLPRSYLEGYKSINNIVLNTTLPDFPKVIFTGSISRFDDFFKLWIAQKKERGSKLVINQNSANYNFMEVFTPEYLERGVADLWLSWGMVNNNGLNTIFTGNLKIQGKKVNHNPNGCALIIGRSTSRYNIDIQSKELSSQQLSYMEEQVNFYESLPELIQINTIVRIRNNDLGWHPKDYLLKRFSQIRFDDFDQPFHFSVSRSRICIITYYSTTFLEVLSWNVPTIIFWNPKFNEINEYAIPYVEILKSAGIYHSTPESAAKHLTEIWNDISSWWESELVQNARLQFCKGYSFVDGSIANSVKTLKNIA